VFRLLSGLLFIALTVGGGRAQLRVTSPYLDVVERYRSGDYLRAVEELAGFPSSGIKNRARRDLTELPCQLLTGFSDCARAREEKPREFERVLEVWATTLPAAAALHVDTATALQRAGRIDATIEHQRLAVELADLLIASVGPSIEGYPRRTGVRRSVWLLSTWLLQLRLDFDQLEMLLIKARQTFPGDALVLLGGGAFHEVRARPFVLAEASEGRQGNQAAWRREERAWRLKSAEETYRQALAADPALAEGYLRLGRVLALQDRRAEAHVALARVAELTTDTRWRYLALLFRAAAYEADRQMDSARAEYRGAVEVWPANQAAHVALSRLAADAADWVAARKELDALDANRAERERVADPWWAYDFGQAWRIESSLAELRATVTR
jgi:tetratricopeptide (TPR) repeat protein